MSMKIFDMKSTSPSFTYLDKTCDNHTMLHSTEYQDNMFRVKGGQASFKAKFKLLVGRKRKQKLKFKQIKKRVSKENVYMSTTKKDKVKVFDNIQQLQKSWWTICIVDNMHGKQYECGQYAINSKFLPGIYKNIAINPLFTLQAILTICQCQQDKCAMDPGDNNVNPTKTEGFPEKQELIPRLISK